MTLLDGLARSSVFAIGAASIFIAMVAVTRLLVLEARRPGETENAGQVQWAYGTLFGIGVFVLGIAVLAPK